MTRYRRSKKIAMRRFDEEAVLVPVRTSVDEPMQVHALNPVGAFVWEALDNELDAETLVAKVVEAFEVDPATASADVGLFLAALTSAGLVEAT